jgi:adenylate kinase family enzyme
MERVLIIGSGGAGKSTLARRLGAATGLPVIHLDAYYWQPGWVEAPGEQWRERAARLAARRRWIMDGNYGGTLGLRLEACDTVIFLDTPRLVCLGRVLVRRLRYHKRTRPDMADQCPERLTRAFVRWIWTYPGRRRPGILRRLSAVEERKRVMILRSSREVEAFLASLVYEPARGLVVQSLPGTGTPPAS